MVSNTFNRMRAAVLGMPFSFAILMAIAANFLSADGHNQQRCIELIALGIGLVYVLLKGTVPHALQAMSQGQRWLCLAFVLLGALASIDVFSPRHAWAEWALLVMLGLAAIMVAFEVATLGTPGLFNLLKVLGVICVLYTLRGLLVYSAGIAAQVHLDFHALAVGFSNARFLNHTQTALIPLLVLMARSTAQPKPLTRVFFLTAAMWWALIFVSEGRATVLALLFAACIAFVLRRRAAKEWLLTMVATAATGLVLYLVLYIALPWMMDMDPIGMPSNILERSAADPASGRQFLWRRAIELIATHPLLGVGPQHFAHFGSDLHIGAHPHNWIFQIASEWGVPAWLCLAAIFVLGARALVGTAARIPAGEHLHQDIGNTFVVAVSAIVVDGLFSGVLVMPQSQLAIALVVGLAIGWARSRHPIPSAAVPAGIRYTGTLLGIVALATTCFVAAPDLSRKWQNAPLDVTEQIHNDGTRWPRLWDAGYF